MPEIISRKEAKALGLKRYFTGKPCKNGHIAERRTSPGDCVECNRKYNRGYYEAYREQRLEYNRKYHEANHEQRLEKQRERYEANREQRREYRRKYYEANHEQILENKREYRQKPEIKARENERLRKRYAQDPWARLETNICRSVRTLLQGVAGEGLRRHWPDGRLEAIAAKLDSDLEMLRSTPVESWLHIPERWRSTDWQVPASWETITAEGWDIDHVCPRSKIREILKATGLDPEDPATRPVYAYLLADPAILRPLPAAVNRARNKVRCLDWWDTIYLDAWHHVENGLLPEALAYHRGLDTPFSAA